MDVSGVFNNPHEQTQWGEGWTCDPTIALPTSTSTFSGIVGSWGIVTRVIVDISGRKVLENGEEEGEAVGWLVSGEELLPWWMGECGQLGGVAIQVSGVL